MENTITLSHEQKKLVEEKVQSGSYTSEREVVGAGLRLLDEQDRQLKKLQEMIQKGLDSGPPIPAEEVFARIEKKLEKRAREAH